MCVKPKIMTMFCVSFMLISSIACFHPANRYICVNVHKKNENEYIRLVNVTEDIKYGQVWTQYFKRVPSSVVGNFVI